MNDLAKAIEWLDLSAKTNIPTQLGPGQCAALIRYIDDLTDALRKIADGEHDPLSYSEGEWAQKIAKEAIWK